MNAVTKTKTILVVEDSPTARKFLRLSLASDQITVLEAGDGIEALETLARETPDLFIVDLNMPRMDGLTLVKKLRETGMYKDTPIVMLTTQTSEEDRQRGYQAGVTVYLTKPITMEKLNYKVNSLLYNE